MRISVKRLKRIIKEAIDESQGRTFSAYYIHYDSDGEEFEIDDSGSLRDVLERGLELYLRDNEFEPGGYMSLGDTIDGLLTPQPTKEELLAARPRTKLPNGSDYFPAKSWEEEVEFAGKDLGWW